MRPPVAVALPRRGAGAYLALRDHGDRLHAGVDLRGRVGADVVAPEDCRVVYVFPNAATAPPVRGWAWHGYDPAVVVLRGASGWFHLLGHLAPSPLPLVGAELREGQVVAHIGQRVGPHCHWQVQSLDVPPRGAAYVEITCDPGAWLAGSPVMFDAARNGCPPHPTNDYRTPRSCRPGARPVQPFPPPVAQDLTRRRARDVATAEVPPRRPFPSTTEPHDPDDGGEVPRG